MSEPDYRHEAYVRIEFIVILGSGDTHVFPDEAWARWFMARDAGSIMTRRTLHTYEGLHAGQRQGKAP